MDPSCGHCLGSDCRGFEGHTDPDCPEHGTAARNAAKAQLDREVRRLSRKSLRKLSRAAPKRRRDNALLIPTSTSTAGAGTEIRKLSERMVSSALIGRRRAKVMELRGYRGGNPERVMSALQILVFRHFNARLTLTFREVWREYGDSDWEVWAVW